MHVGVKFYRGSAAAARSYVEAYHSRADGYYSRTAAASPSATSRRPFEHGSATRSKVVPAGVTDGATYERWIGGYDESTGQAKG